MPGPAPLPDGFRIELDPDVRRPGHGSVLVGGSPSRILRLTARGRSLVDRLAAGAPVPAEPPAQRLARRLLDSGIGHPRPPRPVEGPGVAVVIPVHNDAGGLSATIAALRTTAAPDRLVVVDDHSDDPYGIAAAAGPDATLIRQPRRDGPAAARNAGWRATTDPLIAFLDANCEPRPGWLDHLLPHFADEQVAAVAPRIIPAPVPGAPALLTAYEADRSPLDLGPREASVRPRSRVAYVPSAALVVRRRALEATGGFDETLAVGEDVDLVWRLAAAGWTIRYQPAAVVGHPARSGWGAWLRQRYTYGTSAASLARRHGRAVAPASVPVWSAAAWILLLTGRPRLAAAVAGGWAATLILVLRGQRGLAREACRLAVTSHLRAGLGLAEALRRAWPPAAVAVILISRRRRPVLAAALAASLLVDRPPRARLGPGRFAAVRLVDDLAYATGVWAGCFRDRSARALLPDVPAPFGLGRRSGAGSTMRPGHHREEEQS